MTLVTTKELMELTGKSRGYFTFYKKDRMYRTNKYEHKFDEGVHYIWKGGRIYWILDNIKELLNGRID